MNIKEFDETTSRLWHISFVLGYSFTILLLIADWFQQRPPGILSVLLVIECMGWQVFVYVRRLCRNDI